MKITVYAICKNEEKHVERFMATLDEADEVVVCDTGSTDRTVQALRDLGATVHEIAVNPWRFDVARNASLGFVSADTDVGVCIDLDEVLTKGWRAEIERAWTPATTRLRYQYVWSVNPDGTPGVSFWYDKIHARNGYRWVKPVHEVLQPFGVAEVQTTAPGFTLYHFPDATKSRSSYLPLLELAVLEEPNDDRSAHYYGRELMFYGKHDEAVRELKRHLALPSARWEPERAASMRFIARSCRALGDRGEAQRWLHRACAEAPGEREPWVDLAKHYYELQDWPSTLAAAEQALRITERPQSYICEPEAWSSLPHDLAAVAAAKLGAAPLALQRAEAALALDPKNLRLQENVNLLRKELQ